MAFIQLIQTNPLRKSSEFHMELDELNYSAAGLHATYNDLKNNKVYEITIREQRDLSQYFDEGSKL